MPTSNIQRIEIFKLANDHNGIKDNKYVTMHIHNKVIEISLKIYGSAKHFTKSNIDFLVPLEIKRTKMNIKTHE